MLKIARKVASHETLTTVLRHGKPDDTARKACLSLRQLETATGYSRSKLSRMLKDQLLALADAVANGTWKRSDARRTNAKNVKPQPAESDSLDLANIADRVCAARTLLRIGLAGEQRLEKCA